MTPKRALELIANSAPLLPGCYPSRGAQYYIESGRPIPDFLLPGRAIMRLPAREREALSRLTSDDTCDVPDYAVQMWLLTEQQMKLLSSR